MLFSRRDIYFYTIKQHVLLVVISRDFVFCSCSLWKLLGVRHRLWTLHANLFLYQHSRNQPFWIWVDTGANKNNSRCNDPKIVRYHGKLPYQQPPFYEDWPNRLLNSFLCYVVLSSSLCTCFDCYCYFCWVLYGYTCYFISKKWK